MTNNTLNAGLVVGRHNITDVTDYIFTDSTLTLDPKSLRDLAVDGLNRLGVKSGDTLNLYITGFTPALTATIRVAFKNGILLNLFHYDVTTKSYIKDPLFTKDDVFNDSGYPAWFPDDGINPDVDTHLDLVIDLVMDSDDLKKLMSIIRFVFVNGVTMSVYYLNGETDSLFKASDFNHDCDYLSWLVSGNFYTNNGRIFNFFW